MRIKEMRNRLLAAVDRGVRPLGFSRKPGTQRFYKHTAFGWLSLHLAVTKRPLEFAVAADVAVRFDRLEDLLNQFRNNLSEREKVDTVSLGAELGNIAGVGYTKWGPVSAEEDIKPVADSILIAFEAAGLPYLNKFSTMEAALEACSKDDRNSWLVTPLDGERAKDAMGLAFLLGWRDKFVEIATAKTEYLNDRMEKARDISAAFAAQSLADLESFLTVRNELIRRLEMEGQTQAQGPR